MRLFFLFCFILFFFIQQKADSQVSQGGTPSVVPHLKSSGIPEIIMPPFSRDQLKNYTKKKTDGTLNLKPFRFAHSFEVQISPAKEGIWIDDSGDFRIWKLIIRSPGAYSINLIFENFSLPRGARLFLYNNAERHYLGAFTSLNNKKSGKFAVSPVAGDEITIQYEVPADHNNKEDFIITRVNHDFTGILKNDERRPLGKLAGDCNIDINCSQAKLWKESKDAVCRLIVNGNEICTGTLLNNTAEDEKPYVISAAHCYDEPEYAETTVYTFSYESPYCGPLDGDPSHSVSGALLKAQSDSLDFALTEMSLIPPPGYKPFYAGWDTRTILPDSSVSIHHPQGDIKKIAIDRDAPVFDHFKTEYTPNGFLKINRWEMGVTEQGSSGGPLFNPEQKLIGTLTGGAATCSNPVRDYFSRFDIAWEYKPDSSKQLKYWLDPLNTGLESIEGKRIYADENLCLAYTNLTDDDNHQNVPLQNGDHFSGYWGGTNNMGITGFAERFSINGNEQLTGISLGVGKIKLARSRTDSEITVNVYNGKILPELKIYSQTVKINNLAADAMNFIGFSESVEPADTFFVGFELSNLQQNDTFVVYQSLREPVRENNFFFERNNWWYDFKNENIENLSMTNVFELLVCNVNGLINDTPLVKKPMEALIYPNPARSLITLESSERIIPKNIHVYNLIGQPVNIELLNHRDKKIQIDLSGNIPGVYFVNLITTTGTISKKITWVPW